MSYESTTALSCTSQNSGASPISRLARAASSAGLTSILSKLAASGLVAASAGLGAVYAWTTGSAHGIILGSFFVLFAVALEIAKPLAVIAAFKALGRWSLIRGALLGVLAIVAIAYSLTAELTLMSGSRGDVVAERRAVLNVSTDTRAEAKRSLDRYDAASKELPTLLGSRPTAELQAEIDALLLTPGADGCATINGKVTRDICPKVAALKIEKARADRRAELEAIIATPLPTSEPATTQGVGAADPGASALATYLAALGVVVPVSILTDWLALVPVLALELGSALAGVLVQASSIPAARVTSQIRTPLLVTEAIEPQPVVHVGHGSKTDAFDDPAHVREKVKNAILDQLKERGGEVAGSERGLAALIGTSRPTVRRAINGLMVAGIIAAEATRDGTMLRLVT